MARPFVHPGLNQQTEAQHLNGILGWRMRSGSDQATARIRSIGSFSGPGGDPGLPPRLRLLLLRRSAALKQGPSVEGG